MEDFETRILQARQALRAADALVVGGGAGLSAAAGLTYGGPRFQEHFGPFIRRYGMTDMYSAGFHPFASDEERWGYWALQIGLNRYDPPGMPLYRDLLALVQSKPYFVITTNVDHQFQKAGFPEDRVWAVQGDYGLSQCAQGCHRRVYDNEEEIRAMRAATVDCRIPSDLVPHCPVCGGPMDPNLRKDDHFVEDEAWEAARDRYSAFLQGAQGVRVAFLELGVGFNTPAIIRFPFERMVHRLKGATLIRFNALDIEGPRENATRTLAFTEEMGLTLGRLLGSPDA